MYTVKRRDIFGCISQFPRDILKLGRFSGFPDVERKGERVHRPPPVHLLFIPQEKGKAIDIKTKVNNI